MHPLLALGKATFKLPRPPSLRSGAVDVPPLILTSGICPLRYEGVRP